MGIILRKIKLVWFIMDDRLIYNEHLKEWLQYNDSEVTRIHEKEIKDFAKGSKEPYILFYKKY